MDWLKTVGTKLRGILGLGLVAGFLGVLGGGIWGVVSTLLEVGLFSDPGYWTHLFQQAVEGALYWGRPAAFVGVGFGTTLGLVGRRLSLRSLRWEVAALIGAGVGALFIPLYIAMIAGPAVLLSLPPGLVPLVGTFGATGAALAGSLTLLAKHAEQRELRMVEEVAALPRSHPRSAG